ncbi:hypothetical protein GY45DRAFT_322717 [Cubamyces sp. BRFM 1775]|nr:hypothetical protein GY45DRAFT_322717 [Cubamyces sp. BRFM 1775]
MGVESQEGNEPRTCSPSLRCRGSWAFHFHCLYLTLIPFPSCVSFPLCGFDSVVGGLACMHDGSPTYVLCFYFQCCTIAFPPLSPSSFCPPPCPSRTLTVIAPLPCLPPMPFILCPIDCVCLIDIPLPLFPRPFLTYATDRPPHLSPSPNHRLPATLPHPAALKLPRCSPAHRPPIHQPTSLCSCSPPLCQICSVPDSISFPILTPFTSFASTSTSSVPIPNPSSPLASVLCPLEYRRASQERFRSTRSYVGGLPLARAKTFAFFFDGMGVAARCFVYMDPSAVLCTYLRADYVAKSADLVLARLCMLKMYHLCPDCTCIALSWNTFLRGRCRL